MKKITTLTQMMFCFAAIGTLALSSCNNDKTATTSATDTAANTTMATPATESTAPTAADTSTLAFDINTIPVTTKEIGTFPYLAAPKDYKYNDISKSDLATVHFAVNGKLLAVEGKTYSTNIYKIQESETPFNMQIVKREYDKLIKDLGGVQVSDKLLPGEIEKKGKKLLEDEGDHAYTIIGANDYTLNHVNTYIIRTEKAEIWIELSFYENGGYIYILEKS
ncbi:MAG: hypothetical protein V4594_03065 [Bacteroidota bacterium]